MFKGLLIDAIAHLRECMTLNAVAFVSFIAGIFALKLSGKKADPRFKGLLLLAGVSFVLLLIPVSASIIRIVFGTYYDAPDIWGILPIASLGAVCFSYMAGETADAFNKEKKSTVLLGTLLIICAVLLCGSLGTSREQTSGRPENATAGEMEVARYIADMTSSSGAQTVLLANDDITAAVHGLSADVITLYGRDMWDGRLTKNRYGTYSEDVRALRDELLKMEDYNFDMAHEVCRDAFERGANMVVVPGACDVSLLASEGYSYEIFTASSGETFILISGGNL